ncbi:aldehyde dehydrogenase [Saccharibacillus sp. CPCC 101409]|uniref:aldehyde dehydrogenase n=1 Tax=Saccharibacillus sp. CPCC 101409 TaxID=3058041 RepID=UPI00267359A6|nr:aldehyde dehydrogenase [Saccharibacillus sp. CPCC 101409]MDO3410436.1 aldehyde dehydrogenase [Saccharibacillus sp. CPCC 101409]
MQSPEEVKYVMSAKEWSSEEVEKMLEEHRSFYDTDRTRGYKFRIRRLEKLKAAIQRYEQPLIEALQEDLGKPAFESYTTEIGFVLSSISEISKELYRWSKPQRVGTPLTLAGASSFVINEPYGTVLIIGPFNYPFQLVIEPLIGAIAAGNCAVIKMSDSTPNVSAVVKQLLGDVFEEHYVRVVDGGKDTVEALINASFDYIFFTGSTKVGKVVAEAAAKNLTPVTLELGGKSPAIVDKQADIRMAAKRIIWGKLVNAGQTCIAPDYVLVHESKKVQLIIALKNAIREFLGEDMWSSPDFARIVNEQHFDRLSKILETDKDSVIFGGASDRVTKYIEPTLLEIDSWDAASMQEEIFGPILPILTYEDLNDAIRQVNSQPRPLSLYLFTVDEDVQDRVLEKIPFGGGCINDTLVHVSNPNLPFGGTGASGLGQYHGVHSLRTFSHQKSIVKRASAESGSTLFFPPYTEEQLEMARKMLK